MTQKIDIRFKLLNREAELSSGLIASGLSDFQKITKADSFYYEAFYSFSLGIERLLKLLLVVEKGENKLKSIGHDINKLFEEVNISFNEDSIEEFLIEFFSDFSQKNRYSILDKLSSGSTDISDEPILRFSQTIGSAILDRHNFIPFQYLVTFPDIDYFNLHHIEENFEVNNDPTQIILISKKREFIAKYVTMYAGRIIQPILERLRNNSGINGNPYFYEHFPYIIGDDKYFKNHKTFRRR